MATYTKDKLNNLRFKFKSVEKIENNESQAYQDMFVLSMLDGKENGTFLEIGAFDAKYVNNTYLLEKKFNWDGVSIEINESHKNSFISNNRTSKFITSDALIIDYEKLLDENFNSTQIDYLQLDIEPQSNTLNCLKLLPLDTYRFSVITYETDFYDPAVTREESLLNREESRRILLSYGYEMIVGNVCNTSTTDPFEDWYIDPTVISKDIINLFKESMEFNNTAENYMINK